MIRNWWFIILRWYRSLFSGIVVGNLVNYPIYTETASPDLRTVYVISNEKLADSQGSVLAKLDSRNGREMARIDLFEYANQSSPSAGIALHPTNPTRLYVVVDQLYTETIAGVNIEQLRWVLLEVDTSSFTVTRSLYIGPLWTPIPGGTTYRPKKVRALVLSPSGDAAYTFGVIQKAEDPGTEGTVAWTDLANWVHKGQDFIQDIVQNSGIRAAQLAQGWKFTDPVPCWVPGGNQILLRGFSSGHVAHTLLASLSPSLGLTPVQALSNLDSKTALGWIGDKLFMSGLNISSISQALLTFGASTDLAGFPTVSYVEDGHDRLVVFTTASSAVAAAGNKIIFGGPDGVFVFHTDTNSEGAVDASMISRGMPINRVECVLVGTTSGKALLRIRTINPHWSDAYKTYSY